MQKVKHDKDRLLTQKWSKNEKVRALSIAREEWTGALHEMNEDRHLVHKMNMARRKRMQSEYKRGLVQDLVQKQ